MPEKYKFCCNINHCCCTYGRKIFYFILLYSTVLWGLRTWSRWDLSRSLLSFSSTRGATGGGGPGLAARLPPRIWDNGEAAATDGGRLGDGEEAAMGPASEKDGKRSDGGRSESDGGVLGFDGRTGLRRWCLGDVVADVGVKSSNGDEEDSWRCSSEWQLLTAALTIAAAKAEDDGGDDMGVSGGDSPFCSAMAASASKPPDDDDDGTDVTCSNFLKSSSSRRRRLTSRPDSLPDEEDSAEPGGEPGTMLWLPPPPPPPPSPPMPMPPPPPWVIVGLWQRLLASATGNSAASCSLTLIKSRGADDIPSSSSSSRGGKACCSSFSSSSSSMSHFLFPSLSLSSLSRCCWRTSSASLLHITSKNR